MLFACAAGYLILLVLLLRISEQKHLLRFYPLAKTAVSVGFLIVACAAYLTHGLQSPIYFFGLLPCLLLCLAGDVLLALANTHGKFFSRFFLAGVLTFLCAHIGFCILFTAVRPGAYHFAPLEYLLPVCLVFLAALLTRSRRFQMRHMRVPVLVYAAFVGLMCAKGLHLAFLMHFLGGAWLIAVGSVLFLLSDCVILFLYFYYKPRRFFRFANLSLYYIGLLALALSV